MSDITVTSTSTNNISKRKLYQLAEDGYFQDKKLVISLPTSPKQEIVIATLSEK